MGSEPRTCLEVQRHRVVPINYGGVILHFVIQRVRLVQDVAKPGLCILKKYGASVMYAQNVCSRWARLLHQIDVVNVELEQICRYDAKPFVDKDGIESVVKVDVAEQHAFQFIGIVIGNVESAEFGADLIERERGDVAKCLAGQHD